MDQRREQDEEQERGERLEARLSQVLRELSSSLWLLVLRLVLAQNLIRRDPCLAAQLVNDESMG